MNIYEILALCSIGAISRINYLSALEEINKKGFFISHGEFKTKEEIQKDALGVFIGTLLLLASLIYGFIFHSSWTSLLYLVISAFLSLILMNIIKSIFGGEGARFLFSWVLPIIGAFYFIYKIWL